MMQWAEQHDEACQEMSKRATAFVERLWVSKQAQNENEALKRKLATAYVTQFPALSKCYVSG